MTKLTKILLTALILGVFGIYFSSCEKNYLPEEVLSPEDTSIILEKSGRLAFQSGNHLENIAFHINEGSSRIVLPEGFISAFDAYFNLTEQEIKSISESKSAKGYEDFLIIREDDGELEANFIVDSPVMARLISHKGEIQIGEDVYKITADKSLKAKAIDYDFVLQNNWATNLPQVEVQDIIRGGQLKREVDNCKETYWKNDRKRLKGEIFVTDNGIWENLGARTKHQKKVAWIWWRNRTQELRLQVVGTYLTEVVGQTDLVEVEVDYDSGWLEDDGRDAYQFDLCVLAESICEFTPVAIEATHGCLNDENKRIECSTEY